MVEGSGSRARVSALLSLGLLEFRASGFQGFRVWAGVLGLRVLRFGVRGVSELIIGAYYLALGIRVLGFGLLLGGFGA